MPVPPISISAATIATQALPIEIRKPATIAGEAAEARGELETDPLVVRSVVVERVREHLDGRRADRQRPRDTTTHRLNTREGLPEEEEREAEERGEADHSKPVALHRRRLTPA